MPERTVNPDLAAFVAQRVTGAILALLLLIHLVTIIYAVQDGLSVSEIVERVRGNMIWIVFYGIFIIAAVVHSMIGLRNILAEMSNLNRRLIDVTVTLYAIATLVLGFEALNAIW